MNKPVIGLISGSTRKASLNRKLVAAMSALFADTGAQIKILDLADYDMPIYNGDYEEAHGVPEATLRLIEDMLGCDGIFIASPEYNGSLPPLLKNTIDWTSRVGLDHFKTPVYGIGSASPGALSGIMVMRELRFILARLGAHVVPAQIGLGQAASVFDENGQLKSEQRAGEVVRQMLEAI